MTEGTRALVFGCNSFIGSHLSKFLIEKGIRVFGTVHNINNQWRIKDLQMQIFKCDVRKLNDLKNILKKINPDVIFYMSVLKKGSKKQTMDVNYYPVKKLLDLTDAKIIYPTTNAKIIYPTASSSLMSITNNYIYSKLMAESLPITMTKLSQVIGPCVEEGLIYDVVKSIVDIEQGKKKLLKIGKDLNFKRDYIDVRDVASALYIIGQKRQKGKRNDRYDVCSGKLYVIKNVLKMMIKISKVNIKIEKAYDFPVKEVEFLDNSKIRKLGWKPTIPLKQSIKDTIDFMRNTRNT